VGQLTGVNNVSYSVRLQSLHPQEPCFETPCLPAIVLHEIFTLQRPARSVYKSYPPSWFKQASCANGRRISRFSAAPQTPGFAPWSAMSLTWVSGPEKRSLLSLAGVPMLW
jgi:hypothetical protein